MPRRPRCWLPDGPFHITARGNRRQPIVRSDDDARRLLGLIREVSVAGAWRCHAYCLLPNHFHVVAVSARADMTRAMHRIKGLYAQWFNNKYDLTGHVFEGRYRSVPIESDEHFDEAIRYSLLNPVRAGLSRHPRDWPWSNYTAVATDSSMAAFIEAGIERALAAFAEAR